MSKTRKKKYRHLRAGFHRPYKEYIRFWPRSLARSVAKAKMRRAGVEKPNHKMAYGNWRSWVLWKGTAQASFREPGRTKKAPYVRRKVTG